MTLVQKKFLKPSFTFELSEEKVKVTRSTKLSRYSYEIEIKDLSQNQIEEAHFALPSLIGSILLFTLSILLLWAGQILGSAEDIIILSIFSLLPLILAGVVFSKFRKNTYDLLILCNSIDGSAAISFYRNTPNERELSLFIEEIWKQERSPSGFGFSSIS